MSRQFCSKRNHSLSCQTPESLSCQTSALQLIKSKYPPLTRPPTRTSSRPQHAPFPPNTPTNKNSCRLPIGNFQFSVILKRGDFLDSLHLEFCRVTKKTKAFFLFSKTKLGFKGCEIKNLGKKRMNQRYRITRGTFGLINLEIQVVFFLWISAKSTCFYGNALKNVRNHHDAQEQGIR